MMGEIPLEFFKPFSFLIEGIAFRLEEGSNVIPKLNHLLRWKIFTKKCLG